MEAGIEAPLIDPTTGEDFGIPLVGIVDLILDGDGDGGVGNRALICDFKTTARSSQPIEIVHEIQLTSYSYLFRHVQQRQETGLEIRSLVKTKTPKIEFHRYPARTEAHFARLFAIVREYLDALDSERFNFRPGFGCAMCDFHNVGVGPVIAFHQLNSNREALLTARHKINASVIHGAFLVAALVAWVFGSWTVFLLTLAVLIGTAIHSGDVRAREAEIIGFVSSVVGSLCLACR